MLHIESEKQNLEELCDLHCKAVKCYIGKKLGLNKCVEKCDICSGKTQELKLKRIKNNLKAVFQNNPNIWLILSAKPGDLISQADFFANEVFGLSAMKIKKLGDSQKDKSVKLNANEKRKIKIFEQLKNIFNYDNWFNKLDTEIPYGPYELAKKLDMRSCSYCNREYTITVKSKVSESGKLTRPQFDHWYPKSEYPMLALSFYNLIPSCPTCNSSVKGSNTEINTDKFTHPYRDKYIDFIKFRFEYWAGIDTYNLDVKTNHPDEEENSKIQNTLELLKIREVYNGHHPELDDLVRMSKAYSPEYLRILKTSFPNANLTDEQIYRFAFGTELNSEDFHKRPMSKFKHDILEQLGVIRKTNSSND